MPVRIIPIVPFPVTFATELNKTSTEGQCPETFSPGFEVTYNPPESLCTSSCSEPCPSIIRPCCSLSPFSASLAFILHMRSRRSAYIFVNPTGICCTITIGGVSAGRSCTTSIMASVPPVLAPIAIISILPLLL